jgi:hypothetical protein
MRAWIVGLALISTMLAAPFEAPAQQAYQLPRTPDGHTDFQGNWSTMWITPLERPAEASQLVVPASEQTKLFETLWSRLGGPDPLSRSLDVGQFDVTSLLIVGGQARSSLIVDPPDGKVPFTEAARARRPPPPAQGLDDLEQRPASERCIARLSTMAPLTIQADGNMRQIVQTANHFVILSENTSALRIIPIGAAKGMPGVGRGRWEDDVFVVETSGFAPADRARRTSFGQFSISPKSRITERFTRTGPDEILYAFTVEDSDLYTRPWIAEFALKRSDAKLYEWGCHEGNYSLANILRAARLAEQRTVAKPPRSQRAPEAKR